MNIYHWEHEQLVDHMASRPDIWTSSRPGLWMRSVNYSDDSAVMGLAILPPQQSGPFRQYVLKAVPLAWPASDCETYLETLVRKWTDYGQRKRYEYLLAVEGNIEPKRAASIATLLCSSDQGEVSDCDDDEHNPLPTARQLWPDIADLGLDVRYDNRVVSTYAITGGGWLTIRLSGGMLKVRISVRSDGRYGGGYGSPFEGFIRPADGNVRLASASLFGNSYVAREYSDQEKQYILDAMRKMPDGQADKQYVAAEFLDSEQPPSGSLPGRDLGGDGPPDIS